MGSVLKDLVQGILMLVAIEKIDQMDKVNIFGRMVIIIKGIFQMD